MGIVKEGSRVSNLGFRGIRIRNSHSTRMATATCCSFFLPLLPVAISASLPVRYVAEIYLPNCPNIHTRGL